MKEQRKKNTKKRTLIELIITITLLLIFVLFHQIMLKSEEPLRTPLGQLVEVDGHKMSVYAEGSGDKTLVFLSGSETPSPILDFKSLYSLLSDTHKIVVVERFGYGFSDVVDTPRDIDTVLGETRAALVAAGVNGPYVLCPHSMSGLEALYWAQQYPEEVEAIVGTRPPPTMRVVKYWLEDRMKPMDMLDRMPGIRDGRVTAKKARRGDAPRTWACSSSRTPTARVTSPMMAMQ